MPKQSPETPLPSVDDLGVFRSTDEREQFLRWLHAQPARAQREATSGLQFLNFISITPEGQRDG